jgi:hypothetical protein
MTASDRFEVLTGGPDTDAREARLVSGADELEDGGGRRSILGHERFLISVAAALMTLGISIILVGWSGAANSTIIEEQVPYLISGGLLGLALTTVGALTLFSHWLTVSIREARGREVARREDHLELMAALHSLSGSLAQQEDTRNGATRSSRAQRQVRRAPGGS